MHINPGPDDEIYEWRGFDTEANGFELVNWLAIAVGLAQWMSRKRPPPGNSTVGTSHFRPPPPPPSLHVLLSFPRFYLLSIQRIQRSFTFDLTDIYHLINYYDHFYYYRFVIILFQLFLLLKSIIIIIWKLLIHFKIIIEINFYSISINIIKINYHFYMKMINSF